MMYVGEISSLLAAVLWSISLIGYQLYAPRASALSINLLKNTVALLTCVVAAFFAPLELPTDYSVWLWMLACGAIGTGLGDLCLIRAMQLIGAQLATSIQLFVPVGSILLGYFLLGEELSFVQLLGILLCLAGVWVIIRSSNKNEGQEPTPEEGESTAVQTHKTFRLGLAVALLCTVSFTFGMITMRVAAQSFDIWSGTIVKVLGANAFLLCVKPFSASFLNPRNNQALLAPSRRVPMILFSFLGSGLGLALLTAGGKYAYVGIVSTLASTPPLWLLPLGMLFMGQKACWRKTLAVLVALFGILLMSVPGIVG